MPEIKNNSMKKVLNCIGNNNTSNEPKWKIIVYLTGFGGHEQMLLSHLAEAGLDLEFYVIYESEEFVEKFISQIPAKSKVSLLQKISAYPPLKRWSIVSEVINIISIAKKIPVDIELISSGDIGNFYLLTVIMALLGRRPPAYIPMAPAKRTLPTILSRYFLKQIITISLDEARKFEPPALYVLKNKPPRYLHRIGKASNESSVKNLFWIGRFDSIQKQPLRALTILEELIKRKSPYIFRLNFVGGGVLLNEVRESAELRGLETYIHFWGWQDFTKEISPGIPKIDALINTSDFEGVPLTLLDALDLGIPCFVRLGAISDTDLRSEIAEWNNEHEAANLIIKNLRAAVL